MSIRRHFLGWDWSIVKLAVERLTSDWSSGTLDLSSSMIVVPTKQSGRRLREGLARFASTQNAGVLPPQTVTPDYFIRPENSSKNVASAIESAAAWAEVLMAVDLSSLPSLFPQQPENQQDPKWALGLGEKISRLRTLLSENGLMARDVVRKNADAIEEIGRWEDLALLEKHYLAKLREAGLDDIHEVKIKNLGKNIDLNGVEQLIVLAVPDPTPFSLKAIESTKMAVEVWIHAPDTMADAFDRWGRPVPRYWADAHIPLTDDSGKIRLCGDAQSQADEVIEILLEQERSLDVTEFAIAAPNINLLPNITKSFAPHGVEVYDPAGESLSLCSIYQLIKSMGECALGKQYEAWASLLRNIDFIRYVKAKKRGFDSVRMLSQLDRFQNAHMPDTLESISYFLDRYEEGRFSDLKTVHAIVLGFVSQFSSSRPLVFIRGFLEEIYRNCTVDSSRWGSARLAESASTIAQVLQDMDSPVFGDLFMSGNLQLEILFKVLRQKNIYPEHTERALPVQGWLEMPWEDAPLIIIAGMNEGFVPDSVMGDIFLPDLPREKLGLNNNQNRFARDSYLLTSMIHSRSNGGVYCIVGKNDVTGDPLKPSRLLFRCSDQELLARSQMLFQEITEADSHVVAQEQQWLLKPKMGLGVDHLSATAFKDYLSCPFRFYLKRVLRMEHLDDRKSEADAMEFGNACHIPLELLGKNPELSDCTDPYVIAAFLHDEAEKYIKSKFGRKLSLALTVQLDTIRKRLSKVAEVEAQLRADGWKTLETEYEIGNGAGVELNGMMIQGKIDRIDIRDGVARIIDYKTSDKAARPLEAHVKNAVDSSPDYACFTLEGKEKQWIDLQLPLYHLLLDMDPRFKKYRKECGYFMIPKALDDTGVSFWHGLDDSYMQAAGDCILTVIECVKNQQFWPPNENVKYDDFEDLHCGSLADAVVES